MLNLNTITRRYTPPTCTLQVQARRSPLSRWQSQPVVRDLRFELRFDDPRQLRDHHEQVTIRGDREQLEALCDTVTTYIQDVVLQASAAMPLRSQTIATESAATRSLPSVEPHAVPDALPLAPAANPVIPSLVSRARGLYLQPHGLLQHQLHFGSLAPNSTQTQVQLSVTQLFDLATALDEYSAEVDALPTLRRSTSLPGQKLPAWAGTAASIVLALGVTTALMRLSQYWQNQPIADAPTPIAQGDEPILERSPLGIDAVPPLPSPPPLPVPTLPAELEGLETLPPPDGVGRLDAPIPQTTDTRFRGRGTAVGRDDDADQESEAPDTPSTAAGTAPANPGTRNNQRQLILPRPGETPRLPTSLPPVASAPRPAAPPATARQPAP
ncbi:MAG: DUF4335 domain-containing protein, partial [Spirulinaceae cyanobacterium RM2_2_10]|nr:DUF4335 domain-containing protein [Spirulinaceae cyanobacterium RM2_2_10]